MDKESIEYQQARDIAIATAKEYPPSYYAEPFEPHEWVIMAILTGIKQAHAMQRIANERIINTPTGA